MSEIVEKSVIGAILIDPKCVSEIYEQIRLEMFGSSFCRSVYAEILKAYDAGKQITLISIAQKLQGESFSQERIMQELKGILPDIQAYKIKSYADALVAEYKTRRLKEMDIRESANKANVSSLDSVVSQDNDKIVLRDLIASDQNLEEDAIKKRDREMMQEELNYIIDNLPDEQRRVIQEHYFERRTMKQIGERMGCSGAKAGDIERKALRKLRLPHVNRKYKEYHEQCLTPYPIMHIGIDSFQRTGYSEVERAVLGW